MGNYNCDNNYNLNNYGNRNDQVGPYVDSQSWESDPKKAQGNMLSMEEMMRKMNISLDATNENMKKFRNN